MSSKYKYTWSKARAVKAQIFGEWLEALNDNSPEAVVEAASKSSSPAYPLFEWDDSIAAMKHRLTHAAELRKSLTIEIVTKENKPIHVIAFIAASEPGQVVPVLEASADELSEEENRCLTQMRRFKTRYGSLDIARHVVVAIDEAQQTHARRRPKRKAAKR